MTTTHTATEDGQTVPSAAARHVQTMQILKDHGHASVAKLSEIFGVSEVTIRKDLQALEERDLLVRTHGGAVLKEHYNYDLPFEAQAERHADEKRRIGRAAAQLVEDNDTLILAFGSTTREIARHLRGKRNVTAATDSIYICHELMNNLDVEVLMPGGQLRPTTGTVVGPIAERMLREHTFRKLFLGVDGYDVGYGLTTTSPAVAHLNRVMMSVAEQVIMVTDSSKFGRRGLSLICGPEEIDVLITDDGVPEAIVAHFEEHSVNVIVV